MMISPGFPDKPCGGEKKKPLQLENALEAVGKGARLAAKLKTDIDGLQERGRPPVAPHRPEFDEEAWKSLATYLIEERRLIGFLLGPAVRANQDGTLRYIYPTDICLDCFATLDGKHWRFPDDGTRKTLHARAGRINVRLAHFSWTLTKPDPRLDAGDWSTTYIDQIVNGLGQFSGWLEMTERRPLADTLRRSMSLDRPLDVDS